MHFVDFSLIPTESTDVFLACLDSQTCYRALTTALTISVLNSALACFAQNSTWQPEAIQQLGKYFGTQVGIQCLHK